MSVHTTCKLFFGIVKMDRFQIVCSNNGIKLFKSFAISLFCFQIVTSRIGVACIQTYTYSRFILHLIDDGTLVPVVTRHLVDEVIDVLGRPKLAKYVRPGAATAFEHQMRQLGEWHADIIDPPALTRDPKDDYLVALAREAGVDAIANGDDG